MRETREREKREEDAELLSVYVTQKACAHAHNFVRSATKSALTAVLPLRSGRSASRLAQLVRSAFFLPNYPIQKLLQPTVPLRKKLPQKTHNPKNNNANPHAHNLKK
jgi:hypothetical protein